MGNIQRDADGGHAFVQVICDGTQSRLLHQRDHSRGGIDLQKAAAESGSRLFRGDDLGLFSGDSDFKHIGSSIRCR